MISKKSFFKTNSILFVFIILGFLFSIYKIVDLDSRLSKIEKDLATPNPQVVPLN